jgi:putative ABC transport system substrate-binding protein
VKIGTNNSEQKTVRKKKSGGNSMSKKIIYFALSAVLFALSHPAEAQQTGKVPRIGYVSETADPSVSSTNLDAFRQGLRELGYIEGKNILVEYRYMGGIPDRSPILVADLVQLKVDVLVSTVPSAISAAKQATETIPIVMVTSQDPVTAGIVDSLTRPGGNITGPTRLTRQLSGKRLELFKEVVPTISRVGVLLVASPTSTSNYDATARALKIPLQALEVQRPNPDLEGAFETAAKDRVSALITITNTALVPYAKKIADLAIKYRLPSMYERSEYVDAGGLVSYSANDAESYRRAAWYVDKILKGAKPADLPVEQPTKFELIINLKTAKQIGLTIPPNVLARADKVIK